MGRFLKKGFMLCIFACFMFAVSVCAAKSSPTLDPTPEEGQDLVITDPVYTDKELPDNTIFDKHVIPGTPGGTYTINVPGVEPGDVIDVFIYTPDGGYVKADWSINDDGTVNVKIDQEGDLVIAMVKKAEKDDPAPVTGDVRTTPGVMAFAAVILALMAVFFGLKIKKAR